MPIANVGSVPDVVTATLIATDWGNAIGAASRGRVVQRFNSLAERDSSITAPITGMVCYVLATDLFYGYRTATGWTVLVGGPRDTHHARVSRSAVWTVPNATAIVPYDTIERDPMGLFSTGTQKFTLPVAGVWLVQANAYCGASGAGQMLQTSLYQNGTARGGVNAQSGGALSIQATVVNVIKANAGDTVWVQANAYPSAVSSVYADPSTTFCNLDYLGTG